MAKPRSNLSEILHEICDEVHFQPPTGFKLKYPCIIYELERMNVRRADNAAYTLYDEYLITYITRDPDDSTKLKFMDIPLCSPERFFPNDNLYHYPFKLYW